MRSLTLPAGPGGEPSGRELLRVNSRGHLCLTRERREMLLAEFDRSGVSAARFAEMTGIKYQTFAGWLQERRRRASAAPAVESHRPETVTWIEAAVAPAAPSALKEPQRERAAEPLKVHLPGGAWMEAAGPEQVRAAALLLRELSAAGGAPC